MLDIDLLTSRGPHYVFLFFGRAKKEGGSSCFAYNVQLVSFWRFELKRVNLVNIYDGFSIAKSGLYASRGEEDLVVVKLEAHAIYEKVSIRTR